MKAQPAFRIVRAAFAALLVSLPASLLGSVIAFPGGTYLQNFDGMPTNQNTAISSSASLDGPFPLDDLSWAGSQPYTNTGMAGWQIYETGGTSYAAFSVNDGTSSTSFSFSYGTVNSTDRALGVLAGGARRMAVGAVFQNTSGSAISDLTVSFTGEQWRLGRTTGTADTFFFEYKVGTGTDISGTFTSHAALNFVTPTTTGTVGALNGNDAANRLSLTDTLTGLSWNPNEYLVLRWRDVDDASADHGMAIDDLTVAGIPEPSTVALLALGGLATVFARTRRSSR
jgi:hypothetical protein